MGNRGFHKRSRQIKTAAFFIMSCLMLFICLTAEASAVTGRSGKAPDKMIIRWYNVGAGDCIYIHTPDGSNILVDGGLPSRGKKICKKLKKLNIQSFDYVISTHPDEDHVGGLVRVFKKFQVHHFLYPSDAPYNAKSAKKLMKLAKKEPGCQLYCPQRGDTLSVGDGASIRFVQDNVDYSTPNEDSLALLISYGNLKVLLTGDTSKGSQNTIEQHDVTVTDLPHHGAKNAASAKFIKRFSPEYVVVSADGHTYGHPSRQFFKKLKKYNKKILVYRTDKLGDITITATRSFWSFDKKGVKVGKYAK